MSLLSQIHERINKYNQNFIALMVGGTGSGKSWSSLALANKLDPNFESYVSVDFDGKNIYRDDHQSPPRTLDRRTSKRLKPRNVVFSASEFEKLIEERQLKPGSIIVWDEAGAGMAAREAMRKQNIKTGKILQTFRNYNYGLIVTVPSVGMVDKQLRELTHVMFKPISINRYVKKTILQVREVDHNEQLGKTYHKHFTLGVGNKKKGLKAMQIGLAPKKLRDAYEDEKEYYQHTIYSQGNTQVSEIVKQIMDNHDGYFKKWRDKMILDKELVSTEFNVGRRIANRVKALAEKKYREVYG